MPRQAAAARLIATSREPVTVRLRPPDDLDEAAKSEFLAIVLAVRPDHFQPCDLPLVACYARSIVQERTASGELRAGGYVVDGRPSPWASIQKEAQRSMTTLSRILRLNPQSRLPVTAKEQQVSYYERMTLEGHRDETS